MIDQALPVEVLARIDEITTRAVWNRIALPANEKTSRPAVEALDPPKVLILLALAAEVEASGRRAPDLYTIARKVGMATGTAGHHCRFLAEMGWLIRTVGASRRSYYSLDPTVILGARC